MASREERRDMFAAAALAGMLADTEYNEKVARTAATARAFADALLDELDEHPLPRKPPPEVPDTPPAEGVHES